MKEGVVSGSCERGEDLLAVALELRRADARHGCELRKRSRPSLGDLLERGVVEDDIRRHLVGLRSLEAPLLQGPEGRRQLLLRAARRRLSPSLDPELAEETARPARPRQGEMLAGPSDAYVEQPALLRDRVVVSKRLFARELALLDPGQEDRVPLEPLRAVQRQQVDASLGAVVEALTEPGDPGPDVASAVVELLGQEDQAREVALPRQLTLSQVRGRRLLPAVLEGEAPDFVRDRA